MEVKIDRRFDLPVTVEQAWALLGDVRATAACMPGAQITEQVDEQHYLGLVRSRIGPASMSFAGQLEVLERDAGTRTVRLLGKGGDANGSAATMNLTARVEPGASDGACVLVGQTTVTVSGKLAQFGSRFLLPVAETMLRSFVTQFSQQAAALAGPATAQNPPSSPSAPPTHFDLPAMAWAVVRQWWSGLFRARR